jgi:hypothetical protein
MGNFRPKGAEGLKPHRGTARRAMGHMIGI